MLVGRRIAQILTPWVDEFRRSPDLNKTPVQVLSGDLTYQYSVSYHYKIVLNGKYWMEVRKTPSLHP